MLPDIIEFVIFQTLKFCVLGGGRSVVVVVYVLTFFLLRSNQVIYVNSKTLQEQDIAKMNAVQ